jgi:hypothetical protein
MKLAPITWKLPLRCPFGLALWAFLLGACQKDSLQGVLVIKYEIVVPSRFVPQFGGYGLSVTYTTGTQQTQTLNITPDGNTWSNEFILEAEQRPVLIKFYGGGTTSGTSGKAILNLYINDKLRSTSEYPILNSGTTYGRFNAYPGTSFNIP